MTDSTPATAALTAWRCPEPSCMEPTIPAYICDDGHVVSHAELDHWEDGYPRQPNHHNNWHPLVRMVEGD